MEHNTQIGERLRNARENKGLSVSEAGAHINLSGEDIERIEAATRAPTAGQLISLSNLYEVQTREMYIGPYPYTTEEEWLEAYYSEEITEGTLAYGLKVDRVTARIKSENYLETKAQQAN